MCLICSRIESTSENNNYVPWGAEWLVLMIPDHADSRICLLCSRVESMSVNPMARGMPDGFVLNPKVSEHQLAMDTLTPMGYVVI